MSANVLPQTPGVEYRLIEGFPAYCVGDDGSVWSRVKIVKKGVGTGQGSASGIGDTWRRLKEQKCGSNGSYRQVCLQKSGELRWITIHRLVLEAFVGPCPEGMECCHDDGCPTNNRLGNLNWGTRKKNAEDRIRHGRGNKGERNSQAKLCAEQVMEIRRLRREMRLTYHSIAARYGVSKDIVFRIVKWKVWKHLPVS